MKKVISLALCSLAILTAGAQKANVEQAKKLAGKVEKIGEARNFINQALQNPETANQAETYYIAGKVEWDAFNKNKQNMSINPAKVDPLQMGEELLNGYDYFVQVFPLEANDPKAKYSKELQKKIAEKTNDFFDAGVVFYNTEQFPPAYKAFMTFGDMPDQSFLGNQAPEIADTVRASAYFNAGLCAWTLNELDDAAIAFKKARENNYTDPNACIYEIACWQNLSQRDESRLEEAKAKVLDAATAGYNQFGFSQPVFLNNIVNSKLNTDDEQGALAIANQAIETNPEAAGLYGLRAFVYDRIGNDDASEADYRKAASMPDVDAETLKNASKKMLRIGQNKWNDIPLGDANALAKKKEIKTDYFEAAKQMIDKVKAIDPNDPDVEYILESVDYTLTLN